MGENVKNKEKKSNLITRRRIERAGGLESTSAKKNESVVLDTSVVEKKDTEEKILDKPTSTEEIHQLETEQQEEFLTGIYEEKPIKEENEIESGENRLPAIRGK